MILEVLVDPASGLAGPDFYAYFLDQKNLFEYNDQLILDALQDFVDTYVGRGVLWGSYTPPLLADGGGLNLTIGSHSSIIRTPITLDEDTTWVMVDNATRYLWELQDNTVDNPSYLLTTTTDDPSTDDLPAHLIGTIVTASGAITTITETFNIIHPTLGNNPPVTEIFGPDATFDATHEKFWDASTDDRTGGTAGLFDLVVDEEVDEAKGYRLTRGDGANVELTEPLAFTFTAPSTFTIQDGKKPLYDVGLGIGEYVIVTYTPA